MVLHDDTRLAEGTTKRDSIGAKDTAKPFGHGGTKSIVSALFDAFPGEYAIDVLQLGVGAAPARKTTLEHVLSEMPVEAHENLVSKGVSDVLKWIHQGHKQRPHIFPISVNGTSQDVSAKFDSLPFGPSVMSRNADDIWQRLSKTSKAPGFFSVNLGELPSEAQKKTVPATTSSESDIDSLAEQAETLDLQLHVPWFKELYHVLQQAHSSQKRGHKRQMAKIFSPNTYVSEGEQVHQKHEEALSSNAKIAVVPLKKGTLVRIEDGQRVVVSFYRGNGSPEALIRKIKEKRNVLTDDEHLLLSVDYGYGSQGEKQVGVTTAQTSTAHPRKGSPKSGNSTVVHGFTRREWSQRGNQVDLKRTRKRIR